MEPVVSTLYDLKLLHIVDHVAGQEDLEIGKPLPQATAASEILVKLRSIANVLQIEEPKGTSPLEPVEGDIRQKILALELNISEEDATRKKVQALLQDLARKVEETTPFAQLPLSFEDYRGYENLEVLAGKVPREIPGLDQAVPNSEFESFAVPGFLVVFVAKSGASAMRDFLGQQGFTNVPIPEGRGHPRDALAESLAEKEKWEKRLGEIDERLSTLRERYATFLASAKIHLEIEVEKAEAPLRFAVTEHTFIVEGWVPEETFPAMKAQLERLPELFVSQLESEGKHKGSDPEGADPEPPVLLKNPKPVKPFEMLVNMFGTPSYHEIDPTLVFSLAFPVMFGIMVGDAGYGLLWMVYGIWLLRRWKDRPWDFWKNLLVAFIWGGMWATIFGALFFGEAFGILFHAPPGATLPAEMFNWSDNILHFNIPLHPILDKLSQVPDFLIMSVSVAFLHLGVGFIIGIFDDIRHSVKHAVGKAAWFLILFGLYVAIIVRASRWPGTWGYLIWHGPLGWFPRDGIVMGTMGFTTANPIPTLALGMLAVGFVLMVATEGGLHAMEIFGLLANVISYARLAGIGVAEEAVIVSLNVIILGGLVIGGSVPAIIAGIALMAACNLMMFLLSTISGTIQSVRLNYVEFFLKFYKGTGTLFRPFGERTKSEV
ncbi:MAG TPA: V-type ATP synthase subunit I [Thermoplasmata archaeon]|nr:V-type ATP synthase subunit I [Thermoplasmata archaeon]